MVMASRRIRSAPRQSTKATQHATVTETIGESIDFTRRALSAAFTVCLARFLEPILLRVLPAESLHRAHRLQALLHHADDRALPLAHLVRRLLHRLLEVRDEIQKHRRDHDDDEREVEVQIEHHREHADDGQPIDEDAEQRRGREALDGAHVGRDRAHHVADLVRVVILQREPLEMMIEPLAQIVRHILRDALGVIVVDVTRERADRRDDDHAERRDAGQRQRVFARGKIAQPGEKLRQLVMADHVIDDDLQRPRRGDAHGRLDEHRDENDDQPFAVRPDQFEDEAEHLPRRFRTIRRNGGRGAICAVGIRTFHFCTLTGISSAVRKCAYSQVAHEKLVCPVCCWHCEAALLCVASVREAPRLGVCARDRVG